MIGLLALNLEELEEEVQLTEVCQYLPFVIFQDEFQLRDFFNLVQSNAFRLHFKFGKRHTMRKC